MLGVFSPDAAGHAGRYLGFAKVIRYAMPPDCPSLDFKA